MAAMGSVEIAAAVEAVDRAGDHADVALVLFLVLLAFFFLLLLRFRGFLGPLFAPLLEVLLVRRAGEGDGLAVRGPRRRARAARQIGEGDGLAALRRDEVELRRLAFALLLLRLLGGAREDDARAVRRPARRIVARTAGERARRLAAVRRHDPQRGVVAVLLLVDGDAHEGDLPAVRRNLRIGDPYELEEVGLGDRALGGRVQGSGDQQSRGQQKRQGVPV